MPQKQYDVIVMIFRAYSKNLLGLKQQTKNPFLIVFAGDEEQSGPLWAAEDDDDPENRYGSKSSDVEFVKHPRCGRKAASSNSDIGAKSSKTHVFRTQLQSIQTRPKRSCSRGPAIKYTF